jgi:flagellar biosynthesis/type III secretory pathway chaperone
MIADHFTSDRLELEQVLVRQFKLLKDIVVLTKQERASLLNEPELVLRTVEDKEALLDQMSLMEDRCRKTVQEISLLLEMHSENTSIYDLLPFFKPEDARRIKNLSEGISNLAMEARELNRANQAIALSKLEWLKATQTFLISMFQPESGYRSPKGGSSHQDVAGLGVEFHI